MMRSEKRGSMAPKQHSEPSEKEPRPPKRRRKRAGFFYKLVTMLLLIVLWPVGLVLLWRRKLRWNVSTKLMVTVVTLVACIVLYGFALTVDTGNPKYAAIQDSVNTSLDSAAEWLNGAGAYIGDKAGNVYAGASNFADALWQSHRGDAADLIDEGVKLADQLRNRITGLGQPTEAPTEAPTDAPTDAPTEKPTEAPTDAPTEKPTEAPAEAPAEIAAAETPTGAPAEEPSEAPAETPTDVPTEAPTEAPTEEPTEAPTEKPTDAPTEAPAADIAESKVYIPAAAPDADAGRPLTSGTLTKDGVFTEAPAPEPQITAVTVALKPAKDAAVYYNNGGKYYHIASKCKGMKKAAAHTFGETAGTKLQKCPNCASPEKELLDETYVLWMDADNTAHTSDECGAFRGQYRLIRAADADDSIAYCAQCGADAYRDALIGGAEIIIEGADGSLSAGSAPAEGETAAPAEAELEPAVREVTPTTALKPAGEAPVYHSRTGKWYHTFGTCSGMSYASVYTLAECVGSYKCCNACKAPKPELIHEQCLWQDETGLCHTSNECTGFSGKYTLLPRDTALEKGCSGCSACGADEYLIPGTTIRYSTENRSDDLDALLPAA